MGWQQSQDSQKRTPVTTDNGHLFLAQSTDSQRRSTSLMRTLHYELCAVTDLSFLEEKDLQLTVCRCFQRYTTPNKMILDINFKLVWHQRSYGVNARFLLSDV